MKPDMSLPVSSDYLLETVFSSPTDVFHLVSAEKLAQSYRDAKPYSHVVLDDFFHPQVLERIQNELVTEEVNFTQVFTDDLQKNKTISTGDAVPPLISLIAAKFASPLMLRYLEKLTGLNGLIPDPYYNTDYGYYHIVGAGGVLGSHVDHGRHSSLKIPHVLNLVVYLTPNWNERDGGSLCLYNTSGKTVEMRIACKANRAVIFASTPSSYHGVDPISDSCGRRRHSLYFAYYLANAKPALDIEGFPASQGATTNADESANYGTYFVVPFRELLRPRNWTHLRARLIYLAYLLLPPIIVRAVKYAVRAFRS